jgi:subtilisin family serine protease
MYKLNYISAAILSAFCGSALALDETSDLETTDAAVELATDAAPTALATAATLVKAAPTAAEKTARSYQGWLNQINKPYANQLGSGNGAGVTVGVVDTGVQVSHPSLKGQVLATYNAFTGGTDVTDQQGHGTHVSGIIAGSTANGGMLEGLAPGAKLVMAKVFTTGGSDSVTIGKGIDWVVNVQKAPILSLSLGSSAVSMQTNIQNAVTKGTLITAALGNDGKATASWPAEFAKASWAKGQIIAVGALDANNKRASFSNYDPTLANWTVFAPGVNVASSYSTPSTPSAYAYMSGTSMATPIVAGQAALIKSNWNFLPAADIAQVIFQSATHLCSDSASATVCAARTTADALYGWGLVNVGASLQPIGSLNVGTKTGTVVSYAGAALASPKSGLASGLKGITTLAVDKFNRGFVVNLASAVTAATVTTGSTPTSAAASVSANGVKFSAEYVAVNSVQNLWSSADSASSTSLGKVSYSFTNDRGTSYGFGTGGTAASYFGLQSTGLAPLSLNGEGSHFNAPYFDLAESATHFGYGTRLKNGSTLRLGLLSQGASDSSSLLAQALPVKARSLATLELQTALGEATGVMTLGQLQESDSALAMSGNGALGLNARTSTSFVTLAAALPLAHKTVFSAMATLGRTAAYTNTAGSLIDGASASNSAAWSLGLAKQDILRDGDQLGLTLAMPLRSTSGSLQITTAVSQSQADGALQYASQSASLAPTGSERDLELAYSTPMRFGGRLTALAQVKLQPGHDAEAPTQFGLGVKYVRSFR